MFDLIPDIWTYRWRWEDCAWEGRSRSRRVKHIASLHWQRHKFELLSILIFTRPKTFQDTNHKTFSCVLLPLDGQKFSPKETHCHLMHYFTKYFSGMWRIKNSDLYCSTQGLMKKTNQLCAASHMLSELPVHACRVEKTINNTITPPRLGAVSVSNS